MNNTSNFFKVEDARELNSEKLFCKESITSKTVIVSYTNNTKNCFGPNQVYIIQY